MEARALDDMDLVRVREILGSAAETGLIEHPLFTQSLELLERINAADLTTSSLEKPSSPI